MSNLKNKVFWGFLLAVIGSASYGLNPLFCLPLYADGLSPISVLVYRYTIATILLGIFMLLTGRKFSYPKKELILANVMGLLFSLSSIFLFVSFKYIDAGIASVILFVYPQFVAILSAIIFKEKITFRSIILIVISFIGISLLYKPTNIDFTAGGLSSIIGIILALLSGITYAIYLIAVNRSVLKNMSGVALSFYALVSGTIMLILISILKNDFVLLSTAKEWINAAGLAIFPTLISISLITCSIHMIGSMRTSIFGALEPITALIISITCFGGSLTIMNLVGILLVLVAVTSLVVFK